MTVADRPTDVPIEELSHGGADRPRARTRRVRLGAHRPRPRPTGAFPTPSSTPCSTPGCCGSAPRAGWAALEAHPLTLVEVGRELARGSAALGWLYGLTAGHQWYLSFAHERLQQEVRDSEPGLIVDSLVPGGQAEVVDGGYRLSGRWRFVSGVEWCSWAGLAFVPPNADPPRPIVAFVPAEELTIEDTWRTVGLRGTASNEVTLDRAFVPAATGSSSSPSSPTTTSPRARSWSRGPLFKLPFMGMAAIHLAYTALGVAAAGDRGVHPLDEDTGPRLRAHRRPGGARTRSSPWPTRSPSGTPPTR